MGGGPLPPISNWCCEEEFEFEMGEEKEIQYYGKVKSWCWDVVVGCFLLAGRTVGRERKIYFVYTAHICT